MDDISPNFYATLLDNLYDGVYFVNRDRQITLWNKAAERITGFTEAEVLGKRCADNLLRHVDNRGNSLCEGACPLSYTLLDGQPRSASVFLHHKDGHRLPVAIGVAPITDNQQKIIGAVEIFRDDSATVAALEHLKQLEDLAYLDEMTKIANRTYLENFIVGKFNEFRRLGWSFGVIFVDVDQFKQVNDTFGHQTGDLALKMVAQTLLKNCRSFDLVGRWGGDRIPLRDQQNERPGPDHDHRRAAAGPGGKCLGFPAGLFPPRHHFPGSNPGPAAGLPGKFDPSGRWPDVPEQSCGAQPFYL